MEHEFQEAMAAQDSGDLHRAETLLKGLHRKDPTLFAVNESLGLIYAGAEKFEDALPLLEAAAKEQPASDVAHANLGAVYSRLHRDKQALAELERAAELNPHNIETQQALGQLWMDAHQPQRAAEAFAKALELKPDDSALMLDRAEALFQAGDTAQAQQVAASLREVDSSTRAQVLLGEISEKGGNFEDAAKHFTRAVEIDPSESNVWMLGQEFLRHWTFEAAIREFEAAVAKFPDSTRMRLGLGAAYFGNGTYYKAIPVFADLLQSDANNSLYAELLGVSCEAVMREDRPRCSVLLDYAQAHPGDAKAATYAAAAILAGVQTEQQDRLARKLLEAAIAADPNFAEAHYQLGVLEQNQSDWKGSIASLQTAVLLKPEHAQAHYRLARAYWRTGRKEEGEAEMALMNRYSQAEKDSLDSRLRQITTFVVDTRH